MSFISFRNGLQKGIYAVINPFVRLLIKIGFTPNAVTVTGLILNIGVAIVFIAGGEKGNRGDLSFVGWAGALILFAGLFDMLDGQVARLGNMKSTFGAMFDSVLDRYSELIMFLGICYYLIAHHYFLSSLFAFVAMIGSMMVSYTRARAEGLGVECKGGFMQRPERVVLISVTAIICGITASVIGGDFKVYVPGIPFHVFETMSIFTFPIAVMAVLTNITALRRLLDSRKALDEKDRQEAERVLSSLGKKASIVVGFLMLLDPLAGMAQKAAINFPVPKGVENQLFYLQRDPNTNTIICQLNKNKNGEVDADKPVNVFWMRYQEQGQRAELNLIQKKFAYGISTKPLGNERYELKFVSYSKFPMYLMKDKNKQYHVYATINKKQLIINRIYVHIEGGSFWVPNVKYVEISGVDNATGSETVERMTI